MANTSNNAFPMVSEIGNLHSTGLTKLEYTAIRIFSQNCSMVFGDDNLSALRKKSIEQAKLLLQEIEEASK